MLQHYYDILAKDKFDALFDDLYIGKHPTPWPEQVFGAVSQLLRNSRWTAQLPKEAGCALWHHLWELLQNICRLSATRYGGRIDRNNKTLVWQLLLYGRMLWRNHHVQLKYGALLRQELYSTRQSTQGSPTPTTLWACSIISACLLSVVCMKERLNLPSPIR